MKRGDGHWLYSYKFLVTRAKIGGWEYRVRVTEVVAAVVQIIIITKGTKWYATQAATAWALTWLTSSLSSSTSLSSSLCNSWESVINWIILHPHLSSFNLSSMIAPDPRTTILLAFKFLWVCFSPKNIFHGHSHPFHGISFLFFFNYKSSKNLT